MIADADGLQVGSCGPEEKHKTSAGIKDDDAQRAVDVRQQFRLSPPFLVPPTPPFPHQSHLTVAFADSYVYLFRYGAELVSFRNPKFPPSVSFIRRIWRPLCLPLRSMEPSSYQSSKQKSHLRSLLSAAFGDPYVYCFGVWNRARINQVNRVTFGLF